MPEIFVEASFKKLVPQLQVLCFSCNVACSKSSDALNQAIEHQIKQLNASLTVSDIAALKPIKNARNLYRALGKDPSRYRLSAEALLRRVLKGKGLYQINNVVDTLNLISIETHHSICGYDFHKIKGAIQLGIGKVNEPYQAIGRGGLNIEYLPVFRDAKGAFGTPTSDAVRTMIDADTTTFLMLIPLFEPSKEPKTLIQKIETYYSQYCAAQNMKIELIKPF